MLKIFYNENIFLYQISFLFCFLFSFNDLNSRIVDTIEALENQSLGDESAPIK